LSECNIIHYVIDIDYCERVDCAQGKVNSSQSDSTEPVANISQNKLCFIQTSILYNPVPVTANAPWPKLRNVQSGHSQCQLSVRGPDISSIW
jgi:hypothetical protein